MRVLIFGLLFVTACVHKTEHFLKPNGEIVSCYPHPKHKIDAGLLQTAVEIDELTSGDRALRESTSKSIEQREVEVSSYKNCKDNASLNGWRHLTERDISERREVLGLEKK
ncbi:MAG: hypothetical protein EOP04_00110 [Proteobacteria bacterium]|nr:MAG: hypothetical protein EOP04_00110 [Pseudomonadota bacterium]